MIVDVMAGIVSNMEWVFAQQRDVPSAKVLIAVYRKWAEAAHPDGSDEMVQRKRREMWAQMQELKDVNQG